jgi:hypothetical protein
MHVLTYTVDEDDDAMICKSSEVLTYSKPQLDYFIARSKADPNIYVFEAKRV